MLDLVCNSINHAYLQRYLLAMKSQSLTEAVQAGNEYLQIRSNNHPEMTIRQIEEEQTLTQLKWLSQNHQR